VRFEHVHVNEGGHVPGSHTTSQRREAPSPAPAAQQSAPAENLSQTHRAQIRNSSANDRLWHKREVPTRITDVGLLV
jgi:hypothetical protein